MEHRTLDGRRYYYDGMRWTCSNDYSIPPLAVCERLDRLLSPSERLAARMQAKRERRSELRHFLGYHVPRVMGDQTTEECTGHTFLTSKDHGDVAGDVLWFVGQGHIRESFYLKSHYVICRRERTGDVDFAWVYHATPACEHVFSPMIALTHLDWFREFLLTSDNYRGRGMGVIPDAVVERLVDLAARNGGPFRY